ncbi:MAG: DUF1365 family protein [Alphaproteobacteria bacterium]|nr:DUF1365 family protein [Alphaproteobacteria bacterium]
MNQKDADPFVSAIYRGVVAHRRARPVRHALKYRVFSLLLDLDEMPALDARLKWFSRSRFNLYAFHDRDYGPKPHGPAGPVPDIAAYVRDAVGGFGLDASGPIRLLCYPRILGYAFNPLAVYFIHDASGALSAVMYEVSSTFGERHSYLIPVGGRAGANGGVIRQHADKRLHVSPFMEMDQRYAFRVSPPREDVVIAIRQHDAEGPILSASFAGRREPLTDAALERAFRDYPLMTLKVIGAIHWEAARLLLKGLRLKTGDPAPADPITLVRSKTKAV